MDHTFRVLQTRFPPEVCFVVLAYLHEPVEATRAGLWPVLLCDASYPLTLLGGYAVWVAAAEQGRIEVIEELYRRTIPLQSVHVAEGAAKGGHLAVLRWIVGVFPDTPCGRAIDHAAEHGHLEVVQWLHMNRSEGCTARAMDMAAGNGHLEVMKWLHANRSEGCSRNAMNRAASNGYLEVVKWLDANRSEGCTARAMN
jgi:hypothetical protein